jgi:hypothetical protein
LLMLFGATTVVSADVVCGGVTDAFGATAVVTLLLTVVVHSGVADAVGVSGVHVCGGVADGFVVTAVVKATVGRGGVADTVGAALVCGGVADAVVVIAVVRATVARGGVANAVANAVVTCCNRYCFWYC